MRPSEPRGLRRLGPWEVGQRVYVTTRKARAVIEALEAARGQGRRDPGAARAYALVRLLQEPPGDLVRVPVEDLLSMADLAEALDDELRAGVTSEADPATH